MVWLLVGFVLGVVFGSAGGVFVLLFCQRAGSRRENELAANRRIVESVWEQYPELRVAPYVEPTTKEIVSPRSTLADLDGRAVARDRWDAVDADRPTGPMTAVELDDLAPSLTADDEPTGRHERDPGMYGLDLSRLPADTLEAARKVRDEWLATYPEARAYLEASARVPPPDALQPDGPLGVVAAPQDEEGQPASVQSGRYGAAS